MMTISIKLPQNVKNDIKTGVGTTVFNDKGQEIKNITSIKINISLDDIVSATIDVAIKNCSGLENIHALLGTKTLEQVALFHGFRLERIIEKDTNCG